MKYPMVAKWIRFEREDSGWFRVENLLSQEVCFMTDFMASFAMKLDGKTPPQQLLPPGRRSEAEALVSELDQWDLLRHTRILDREWGIVYWSIFFFDKNTKLQVPCRILNALLQLFFFPALLIGIAISWDYLCSNFTRLGISLPGMIVGGILGIIAHEAGHTIAGISYRAAVYECGVMVDHFVPGAYVMVDTENLKNKQHIIQIEGAGVEANFLLAGVFLIAACQGSGNPFFFWSAVSNIILGGTNCLPINQSDGMHILEALLEVDNLYDRITYIMRSKKVKKRIKRSGLSGHLMLCLCYFISALNFIWRVQFLPVILIIFAII